MNTFSFCFLSVLSLSTVIDSKIIDVKIKKRDLNPWCTYKECSLCEGSTCKVTCKGYSCGECPNGECCNGQKCNACFNDECCTSYPCNRCMRFCKNKCKSDRCTDDCHKKCLIPDGDFVKLFALPEENYRKMIEVDVNVNGVLQKGFVRKEDLESISQNTKYVTVFINSIAYQAEIIRKNPLRKPKSSNDEKFEFQYNKLITDKRNTTEKKSITKKIDPKKEFEIIEVKNRTCCQVVHPESCHFRHIKTPNMHCYRKTHHECSSLCISSFVHFASGKKSRNEICHKIQHFPFVYCGHYHLESCDKCYICDGKYDPFECHKKTDCSDICKKTMPLYVLQKNSKVQAFPVDN